MPAEKNFENRIKSFLKENNIWFVKFFANGFTKSGVPDILACIKGRFVGIEVKAEKGKPSPLQIYNKEQIEKSGGIAYILYPKDFEQFKKDVKEILDN